MTSYRSLAALAFSAAALSASPALAIDCAKAKSRLEKTICGDKALKSADDAMSAAFARVFKLIADPEIRAALLASQRRWVVARESELGDLRAGAAEEGEEPLDPKKILLDAAKARAEALGLGADGKPVFVSDALKQRERLGTYGGGPFAGYAVRCSFIPDRADRNVQSYQCFGARSLQNGDRVCTEEQDFASWSMAGARAVADVVDGRPKVIATCALNSSRDEACPDVAGVEGSAGRWNLAPTPEQARLGDGSARLEKLAPELGYLDEDQAWLKPCLTDKAFPTAAPAANRANGG